VFSPTTATDGFWESLVHRDTEAFNGVFLLVSILDLILQFSRAVLGDIGQTDCRNHRTH
jgi:hypothetical protein